MGQQAGFVQQQIDDFAQCHAGDLLTQHIQHGDKAAQVRAGLAGCGAHGVVQRATRAAGNVLQLLNAACTDPARRKVHHA